MIYKFKKNETFRIRDGWIEKALNVINDNNGVNIFQKNDGIGYLGVGSNMVKAIKYWLTASNLIGGKNNELTNLGRILLKYDPYLEDIFSLWFIHYQIATNVEECAVISTLFNEYPWNYIERNQAISFLTDYFNNNSEKEINVSSMINDLNVFFSSYSSDEFVVDNTPEDNMLCPLCNLGLLEEIGHNHYKKKCPPYYQLNSLVVYYSLLKAYEEYESFSIDDALDIKNGPGKLFNIPRNSFVNYLNELSARKLLIVNTTAGLNMVYFADKKMELEELFRMHYGEKHEEIQ